MTEKVDPNAVQHWAVSVAINGENILTIESNCLSGIDNIADYDEQIRDCAHHLLAFIGATSPRVLPVPSDIEGLVGEINELTAKNDRQELDFDESDWNLAVDLLERAAATLQAVAAERDALEGIIAARDKQLTEEIALSSKYVALHQAAEARIAELTRALEKWQAYDALLRSLPRVGPIYGGQLENVDAAYDDCVAETIQLTGASDNAE